MIASINNETKDIKLVSIYRDTYLDNTNGEYRKATECYQFGGPKRSMNMINKNLDMDITDYVTVNFNAVAEVVNALGGVEIDIQEDEIVHLNNYQVEGSGSYGIRDRTRRIYRTSDFKWPTGIILLQNPLYNR